MSVALWVVAGLGALLVGWVLALGVGRVRRLDRLHVRTDAARAGLAAALDRRVAAALAAHRAADPSNPVRRAAEAAREAGPEWSDREAAENRLGRALAGVDRAALPAGLRAELAEAEMGLVLARHVHNDAVRDTLGLRSRRLVRWLRLAGTAPLPRYFEIADPGIGPEKWATTGPL